MSDAATQSELGQVLAAIKSMQSDIQAMDKKLDLHIATTAEKFNTLEERLSGEIKAVRTEIQSVRAEVKALDDKVTVQINAVQTEVKALDNKMTVQIKALDDKVTDLRDRQKVTDSRLWAFIVALVTLVGGSVIKVLWFDRA